MRRALTALALTAAAAAVLSACSSGAAGPAAPTGPGPVTITWWDTSDAEKEAPAYRSLVADFEKANPGIRVAYTNVPFDGAREEFKAAAGTSDAPDVLRAYVGWTADLAKSGDLASLDGTVAAADSAKFQPALIEQATYGGKLYGIPQVTDTLALMYNKDLFAKAGIAAAPATWDELRADAGLVKERTGVDGFAFNPQDYYAMPFLYGEGADLVDVAGKRITVGSPAAVAGIDTLRGLLAAPGVAGLDTTENAYATVMDAFSNGKAAAVLQGPWETAALLGSPAFPDGANLGIAAVPAGGAGRPGSPLGGHNLVVNATSDAAHRAAAQKFVAFMTSAGSQAFAAARNATMPTRDDAYTAEVTTVPGLAGFRALLPTGRARPALAEYTLLYEPFGTELAKILAGQEDTRTGLANAAAESAKLVPDYTAP
ncbi:extracellular solute-binding protein [Kitasatospora sp. NPDC057223]|uniref:extracellular solute-binding protein n=1 Tax=Kitasatospora sp. NPDC057223 TaxID=3346055 RepID=UPI003629DD25